MRRCAKKKNVAVAVLLLVCGLFFINHSSSLSNDAPGPMEPVPSALTWHSERLISRESWVERGDYLPLNVSYQLLAGAPSTQQRFLAVGLSSVRRTRGSYLVSTLRSLFSQSSPEERGSMVVVALLADFDPAWRADTVREISAEFPQELQTGLLLLIHVPQDYYPPLSGLKRNFNDAPERVAFRSKQNLDYSFLIHYSAGLGRFYLQLEDDVLSARSFLSTIRRRVAEQSQKTPAWAMLEFSSLGYIGKLYRSEQLPLLARFLFLFYQEMPCDWLMSHFRELMTQKQTIVFKPSLFQHMGTFSSFQGTYNKLKDKDFEEGFYSNPPAKVYTDMSVYQKNLPQRAWEAGESFFWGRTPDKGNHLTVVLQQPAVLSAILVETGSGGKDLLDSARVEIGRGVVSLEREQSCGDFQPVGVLENGRLELQGLDKNHTAPASCLRVLVTAAQKDWVIIQKIRVTTRS